MAVAEVFSDLTCYHDNKSRVKIASVKSVHVEIFTWHQLYLIQLMNMASEN